MIRKLLICLLLLAAPAFANNTFENYMIGQCGACKVYWPENESSGTTLTNQCNYSCGSSAASAYNMTTSGTPSLAQSGVNAARGTSISYTTASSQYAEANVNDSGSGPGDIGHDVTFSCWANLTSFAVSNALLTTNFGTGTGSNQNSTALATNTSSHVAFILRDQGDPGTVYINIAGSTTLSTSTWYMLSGVWTQGTHTVEAFVNGVSDGSTSTIAGTNPPTAVQYFDIGRQNRTNPIYEGGKSQDCYIFNTALSASTLLQQYNRGIALSAIGDWPFTVKLELPAHMDQAFVSKVVERGYLSGHFGNKTLQPQLFFAAYLPLQIIPNGHGD